MKTTVLILGALAILAAPALSEDDGGAEAARLAALERQAKVSIEIFRKNFKGDTGRKATALLDLARVRHDSVVDEFGKRALRDPDPEVRMAAAQLMADFDFNAALAGKYLRDNLSANEEFPQVQKSIVRSIGKLRYAEAVEELKEAAKRLNEEPYRDVTVEVVRAFGAIGDPKCLPFLLWMAEYGGHALKWSTGEVSVDTGASGDVDQRAAEAAWQAKYGHVKPKRPPAPIIRMYMQELETVVKKLTGQTFTSATEFRKWLEANAKSLGLTPKDLKR
ncbi:MAG: HEAT repeat domain-containing protein [Planctomycetes bacterium]|jgi:hypothetical protein|nr:HEAT repeat domain-containing protein [Planctomycetota bacterium]